VNDQDKFEIVNIVKKFADLGMTFYATKGTADVIRSLGLECTDVARLSTNSEIFKLMDDGKIDYIVYTGKTDMESITNYMSLHHHAILLGITVLTSLDTTNALADCIAGRYSQFNTELIDINNLRKAKLDLKFNKMQSCGNDYIVFNNMCNKVTCPESLAINILDRHYGIGGDGVVMIETSKVADAKIRVFSRDGSDSAFGANPLRCVAKYLFDNKFVLSDVMHIETSRGVKTVTINSFNQKVSSVAVNLGTPTFKPQKDAEDVIQKTFEIDGKSYTITYVNIGNPHVIIFCDSIDDVNMEALGQAVVSSGLFPADVFVNCVRFVNNVTLRTRIWERENGETFSCGTAAAAAAIAAVKCGFCVSDKVITVKMKGGDMFVKCLENGEIEVDGSVKRSFEGVFEI
jgi:carbamoyl-phosphate synthase large subunit